MYPSGITTVVNEQKGAFVEVKGYGDMMSVSNLFFFSACHS